MFAPLAILFWLVVVLAPLAGGVALLVLAVRRRSWRHALAGGGVLACLVFSLAWANSTGVDEWHPRPAPASVVGTWKSGGSRIDFFPDGTFRIAAEGRAARRIHIIRAEGQWELAGANLRLRAAGGVLHELRVVIVDNDYRIIEEPGHLDSWVRWKGFTRTSSRPGAE